MSIALEVLPDAGAPQVGVTVSGLDGASTSVVSIDVSWDGGGTWHGVREADRVAAVGGLFVRDHVPPLNVEATYRLTVHSGAVVPTDLEATITVVSEFGWLQDPLDPRSAVAVLGLRDGDAVSLMRGTVASLTRRQAADVVVVEGARYPVASVGVRQAPANVPLGLRALAAEQGALVRDLRALFDSAGTLVLRGLPSSVPLDAVAHVIAGDVVESPVVGGVLGVHNDWDLSVTQVRPTSMRIVVPWWTYAQVKELWGAATYADVEAARPGDTYLDWQRSPEVP